MPGLGAVTRGLVALRRQFPNVEDEALELFADAGGGRPDHDGIVALGEMQLEAAQAGPAASSASQLLPTRSCEVRLLAADPAAAAGRKSPDEDCGRRFELRFEGGEDPPRMGTVLLIEGLDAGDDPANPRVAAMAIPTGEVLALEPQAPPTCFWVREYGMHELRLQMPGGAVRRCSFMVTSQLGDFAATFDHFNDSCDWVWDGQWTEELEEATMELLAALDNHFGELEAMFARSPMGSTMLSELEPSRKRLESSLAKALEQHDVQAVGRVYSAVRGLLSSQSMLDMFAPMLGGTNSGPLQDSPLYHSVIAFERARFAAASEAKRAEVRGALSRLIDAADAHVAEAHNAPSSSELPAKWHRHLRDTFVQMRDDPEAVIHPLPFQQLRGGGGGHVADLMRSMADGFGTQGGAGSVRRADAIEAVSVLRPQASYEEAQAKVNRWAESLVDESVSFGSPVQPFVVHGGEPWVHTVMAGLQSLLSLGFGYVTQGPDNSESSKMVALLDRVRASLPLDDEDEFLCDRRRRDRLKDVCRVVRAARKKGQRLSLSANTDFAGALRALREHHSDNWVGPSLEAVWRKMLPEHRVFAFELWLHESGAPEGTPPRLVAADFGHPHTHGQAYYVATRFFDREFRNLQPGFILAFAEAACLKHAGFALWDLGGADKSPMMQYKPQVAIEMDRSDFLRRLRECGKGPSGAECPGAPLPARMQLPIQEPGSAAPACGDRIPVGVVFEDIQEDDLWGAVHLRAKEEAARLAQEAASKAAKKQQRPPKAARNAEKAAKAKKMQGPALGAANMETAGGASGDVTSEQAGKADGALVAEKATVETSEESAKAAARQQFMSIFQRLMAEGLTRNDAAASALQLISSSSVPAA